jgi:hypothetical protein
MKKFRSTWFRVAVEGATSDKRTIERSWLEQAAKNFNQGTYGARIWLEHFRSIMPDGPFKAYGDVSGVKTEEVVVNGQKKMALFAQIEPTDELIAMNKAKQKIYTSIEIDEKFADTGEAYLVGLAVTDSPASLGTDVLAFSAQKPESSPFKDRHFSATSMFTEALEVDLEFEEVTEPTSAFAALKHSISSLISKGNSKAGLDAAQFSDLGEAIQGLVTLGTQQATQLSAVQQQTTALAGELSALKQQLGSTQQHSQTTRPPVTGSDTAIYTDC